MRIVCPSCSAAYDVPDSLLSPGRTVRCARCGSDWTPTEAAPSPPSAEATERAPETGPPPESPAVAAATRTDAAPIDTTPDAVPSGRRSAMERLTAHAAAWSVESSLYLRLAWAGSITVLILLVGAAYAWRSDIVTAWPPSARAYAAFGLRAAVESSTP